MSAPFYSGIFADAEEERRARCYCGHAMPSHARRDCPSRIGPEYVYVNARGVRFVAWLGADVSILRVAASL